MKKENARLWYQNESIEENWSTRATLAIILCADRNETVVKYSMLADNQQLFAYRYKLHLPSEEELQQELSREIAQLEGEMNL